MITETFVLLPELFLSISLIYIIIHSIFLSTNKTYPLLQNSVLYLSILVLIMVCFLLINDNFGIVEYSIFNNTITNDYLSYASKILIVISCIFCLLIVEKYLIIQKINNFEYILIFLFAILGIFLLCSSNDLISAYLAIELQSLSFYIWATFKKNSTFSIDAGLKYFILGAFSFSIVLFGSSIICKVIGITNFEDLKTFFELIACLCFLNISKLLLIIQNFIYSVLLFVLSFIYFASLLFLLECEFIALIFIIIYVGAIAVLFLFVVMILRLMLRYKINKFNKRYCKIFSIWKFCRNNIFN